MRESRENIAMASTAHIVTLMLMSVCLTARGPFFVSGQYTNDPECSTYDHSDYGCVGQCMLTSECPGGKYISNLCPSSGSNVKCCFTADSDEECVNGFSGGYCISTSECPNNDYVSNYCPTKPAGVKCCRTKPIGTCEYPNDEACATYDHSDYGCVGQCMETSECPGAQYISNLCPSSGSDVKCCFTADSDAECVTGFSGGYCISTSDCPNNDYVSNYCPTKPAGVKCCRTKPIGTCLGCSGQQLACDVQSNENIYLIDNNGLLNSNGNNDGADPESNIEDMCNGDKAKRSSYSCSSGTSPGGEVCLQSILLQYLLDLADAGYSIQVNSLAGACHSTTSKHYLGTAVDIQIKSTTTSSEWNGWMQTCTSSGGTAFGPGTAGHSTHVHCQFNP